MTGNCTSLVVSYELKQPQTKYLNSAKKVTASQVWTSLNSVVLPDTCLIQLTVTLSRRGGNMKTSACVIQVPQDNQEKHESSHGAGD